MNKKSQHRKIVVLNLINSKKLLTNGERCGMMEKEPGTKFYTYGEIMFRLILAMVAEEHQKPLMDLYKKYYQEMVRIAERKLGPKHDSEAYDIASEAYKKIADNYAKIYPIYLEDQDKYYAYIRTIVRNTAVDFLYKHSVPVQSWDDLLEDPPSDEDFVEEFNQKEEAIETVAYIRTLPEIYHTVLELRFLQEMEVCDIAKQLNIPESTVYTRLSRAKTLMKEMKKSATKKAMNY